MCSPRAAQGRPLWRKPEPAPALLPVSGDPEAEPARPAGALSAARWGPSASIPACMMSALSRTIGRARRSAPGAWAGNAGATAWSVASSPISSRSRAVECAPVSGELTYGLERLAMYVQGVENVYDLNFNGAKGRTGHLWRCLPAGRAGIFAPQFRACRHGHAVRHFKDAEAECRALLAAGDRGEGEYHGLALPAYDQCIKASHAFNLLDARGVISVTERQSYILRVREWQRPAARRGCKPRAAARRGCFWPTGRGQDTGRAARPPGRLRGSRPAAPALSRCAPPASGDERPGRR
jgi:hypothetical protein